VTYRAGGGLAGNIAPLKTWDATYASVSIQAQNVAAASGGAEPETIDEASLRIAGELKQNRRAVTALDHEELARTTPGVAIARARAVVGLHPPHPCAKTPGAVTVFIVPYAPRPDALEWTWPDPTFVAAPRVDPGALAEVQRHLDAARLVTSQIFVRPITYRAVSLRVEVGATPADVSALEQRLGARLSRYLDPLEGGEAGAGLPFGEPVRPSALVKIAQDALMGEADVEQVSVGLDESAASESCRDVAIGPYELAYLRRLTIIYRAAAFAGGLP
jgi:predicted phage baseplate assembly protein